MKRAGTVVRIHVGRVRRERNRNVSEGSVTMEIPDPDRQVFERAVRAAFNVERGTDESPTE
jgi:hypothetical protein